MRLFAGAFFAAMGIGVHGALVLNSPEVYPAFAHAAPIAAVRAAGHFLTASNPELFGVAMMALEVAFAVLILRPGRHATLGLWLGAGFLLVLVPLGVQEVPNVLLAVGLVELAKHEYAQPAWEQVDVVLRSRNA